MQEEPHPTPRSRRRAGPIVGLIAGFAVGAGIGAAWLWPEPRSSGPDLPEATSTPELTDEECSGPISAFAAQLGIDSSGEISLGRCEVVGTELTLRVARDVGVVDGTYPVASLGSSHAWTLQCATIDVGPRPVEIPLEATGNPDICGSGNIGGPGTYRFIVRTAQDNIVTVDVIAAPGRPRQDELISTLDNIQDEL